MKRALASAFLLMATAGFFVGLGVTALAIACAAVTPVVRTPYVGLRWARDARWSDAEWRYIEEAAAEWASMTDCRPMLDGGPTDPLITRESFNVLTRLNHGRPTLGFYFWHIGDMYLAGDEMAGDGERLRRVALHEFGHACGILKHGPAGSVMYFQEDGTSHLTADDLILWGYWWPRYVRQYERGQSQ